MTTVLIQNVPVQVDDDMAPALSAGGWYIRGGYVTTGLSKGHPRQPLRFLHRIVLGLEDSDPRQADHIDGDPLNNTRANLRVATASENTCNTRLRSDSTSGFKGVSFVARDRRYQAQIMLQGKRRSLGYYDDPRLAALIRDRAAVELHGDFAGLNFPERLSDLLGLPSAFEERDALILALKNH